MMACSWQVIWRCENMSAVQVEEFDFMLHYSDKTSDSCAWQKFRHKKLTASARFQNMQCSRSRLKCTHLFHLLMLYLELLPLTKVDAKIGKQTARSMQLKIHSSSVTFGKFCPKNSALFLGPPKILCSVPCALKKTRTFFVNSRR